MRHSPSIKGWEIACDVFYSRGLLKGRVNVESSYSCSLTGHVHPVAYSWVGSRIVLDTLVVLCGLCSFRVPYVSLSWAWRRVLIALIKLSARKFPTWFLVLRRRLRRAVWVSLDSSSLATAIRDLWYWMRGGCRKSHNQQDHRIRMSNQSFPLVCCWRLHFSLTISALSELWRHLNPFARLPTNEGDLRGKTLAFTIFGGADYSDNIYNLKCLDYFGFSKKGWFVPEKKW